MKDQFTANDINKIVGLSQQKLYQLRLFGIISPSIRKNVIGGINIYSFDDLFLIAIALRILDFGIKYNRLKEIMIEFGNHILKRVKLLREILEVGGEETLLMIYKRNGCANATLTPTFTPTHVLLQREEKGVAKIFHGNILSPQFINSIREGEIALIISIEKILVDLENKIKSLNNP
jgi:DNA-binding transcriptional MerR regulator